MPACTNAHPNAPTHPPTHTTHLALLPDLLLQPLVRHSQLRRQLLCRLGPAGAGPHWRLWRAEPSPQATACCASACCFRRAAVLAAWGCVTQLFGPRRTFGAAPDPPCPGTGPRPPTRSRPRPAAPCRPVGSWLLQAASASAASSRRSGSSCAHCAVQGPGKTRQVNAAALRSEDLWHVMRGCPARPLGAERLRVGTPVLTCKTDSGSVPKMHTGSRRCAGSNAPGRLGHHASG